MSVYRNIQLPPKVRKGEEVTAEDHNLLIDAIIALSKKIEGVTIKTSADVGIRRADASGILLYSKRQQTGISRQPDAPLTIVRARPSYVPAPVTTVQEYHARFYMTWGVTNGILADNWGNCVDVPTDAETVRYIDMKAYLAPSGDFVGVTHCEWVTYTQAQKDAGDFQTPDYSPTGGRPAHMFVPIGMIVVDADGNASILNAAGGSIQILEYVAGVDFSGGGGVKYRKSLNPMRLTY